MTAPTGRLLMAAVGFAGCAMPSYDRALHALRTGLDSWRDIGHVAVGMHRQGYNLQLTQYDEKGWRATFYMSGNLPPDARDHATTDFLSSSLTLHQCLAADSRYLQRTLPSRP